jgi:predicted SnoaL-like aldol condensation-catalyzing enzyme
MRKIGERIYNNLAHSSMMNKQLATQFLTLVVSGKIDEAYKQYVDMSGKHHNVYFAKGFDVLRDAMKESHEKFPHKQFSVQSVIGDGEMVAVHSHLIMEPGREMSVVHIFRFHNGKIVEMWDCGQALPGEMPNADGAF